MYRLCGSKARAMHSSYTVMTISQSQWLPWCLVQGIEWIYFIHSLPASPTPSWAVNILRSIITKSHQHTVSLFIILNQPRHTVTAYSLRMRATLQGMPHPAHDQQVVIFQCHSQNLSYECDMDIMASLIVSQTWHSGMAKSFVKIKSVQGSYLGMIMQIMLQHEVKQSCSYHETVHKLLKY